MGHDMGCKESSGTSTTSNGARTQIAHHVNRHDLPLAHACMRGLVHPRSLLQRAPTFAPWVAAGNTPAASAGAERTASVPQCAWVLAEATVRLPPLRPWPPPAERRVRAITAHGVLPLDCGGQSGAHERPRNRGAGAEKAPGDCSERQVAAWGMARAPTGWAWQGTGRPRRTWRPQSWRPRTSWQTASCSGPGDCSASADPAANT